MAELLTAKYDADKLPEGKLRSVYLSLWIGYVLHLPIFPSSDFIGNLILFVLETIDMLQWHILELQNKSYELLYK